VAGSAVGSSGITWSTIAAIKGKSCRPSRAMVLTTLAACCMEKEVDDERRLATNLVLISGVMGRTVLRRRTPVCSKTACRRHGLVSVRTIHGHARSAHRNAERAVAVLSLGMPQPTPGRKGCMI
jgi:hypothetical protein